MIRLFSLTQGRFTSLAEAELRGTQPWLWLNEALGFIPAPLITGKEGERNTRRERGREGFRVIPSKPHHPVYAVGYLLPSPSYQLC